jgi:hypothetical protein
MSPVLTPETWASERPFAVSAGVTRAGRDVAATCPRGNRVCRHFKGRFLVQKLVCFFFEVEEKDSFLFEKEREMQSTRRGHGRPGRPAHGEQGEREERDETSLQGRIAFRCVKSSLVSSSSAFARDKRGAQARVGPEEERRRSPELGSSPPPRAEAHGRDRHPLAPRKKEEQPCPGERASGQQTRRSSGKVCATPPALAAGTADEPLASGERRGSSVRPGCIVWRHPRDREAGSLRRRAPAAGVCARARPLRSACPSMDAALAAACVCACRVLAEQWVLRVPWRRTRSRSTHTWQPGAGSPGRGKAPANTFDDDSDQGQGDGLSAYEKARLKRIADNQLTLLQLGIADLAQKARTLAPKKPHGRNKRRCVPVPCAEHERELEAPALCVQAQTGLHQRATSACTRGCVRLWAKFRVDWCAGLPRPASSTAGSMTATTTVTGTRATARQRMTTTTTTISGI